MESIKEPGTDFCEQLLFPQGKVGLGFCYSKTKFPRWMWSAPGLQELVDYELNKAGGIGKATVAQSDVKKGADAEIESAAAGLSQVARNKKIGKPPLPGSGLNETVISNDFQPHSRESSKIVTIQAALSSFSSSSTS